MAKLRERRGEGEDVVAQDGARCGGADDVGQGLVPSGEPPQHLGVLVVESGVLRKVGGGEPVDPAVQQDRRAEHRPAPPRLGPRVQRERLGRDASPGRESRVSLTRVLGPPLPADAAAQAVGGHHEVGRHVDALALVVVAHLPVGGDGTDDGARDQGAVRQSGHQLPVELGPVDQEHRERRIVSVDADEPPPVGTSRAAQLHRRRGGDVGPDAECVESSERVGPERDAGTDLAGGVVALEDRDVPSGATQRDARCESADASSDDDGSPSLRHRAPGRPTRQAIGRAWTPPARPRPRGPAPAARRRCRDADRPTGRTGRSCPA